MIGSKQEHGLGTPSREAGVAPTTLQRHLKCQGPLHRLWDRQAPQSQRTSLVSSLLLGLGMASWVSGRKVTRRPCACSMVCTDKERWGEVQPEPQQEEPTAPGRSC